MWTISIHAADPISLAAARVQECTINLISRDVDVATLIVHPDVIWLHHTPIVLYYDTRCVFRGHVAHNSPTTTGTTAHRTYTIHSVTAWLARTTYRQPWMVWRDNRLGTVPSSRVVLNSSTGSNHITAAAQLKDIIDWAASQGAPIAWGSCHLDLTLPIHEDRDISCAQAIESVLRFAPTIATYVDYAADPPEIHFTADSGTFPSADITELDYTFRHDLVVPSVTIEIERLHTADDAQYRTLDHLIAPPHATPFAPGGVHLTLPLAGVETSTTRRHIDVSTTDIPASLDDLTWWRSLHPRLATLPAADITIVPNSGTRAHLIGGYPRISATPLPDLTAAGQNARLEKFTCECHIIQRKNGVIVDVQEYVHLEMELLTTTAKTRSYQWTEAGSSTSAESCPPNLAADLYAQWSTLYAQGKLTTPLRSIYDLAHPAQTIPAHDDETNIIVQTPIQTVTITAHTASIDLTFGPPSHLLAQDYLALLNATRTLRTSTRFQARATATPPGRADSQAILAPASSHSSTPGAPAEQRISKTAADNAIHLDPSDLADATADAKFRTLSYLDATGTAQTPKILSTAAITIPPAADDLAIDTSTPNDHRLKLKRGSTYLGTGVPVIYYTYSSTYPPDPE